MDFDTECKSTITYQLHYLLKEMWTQQVEITPRTFKKIIGTKNELFSGYDQNDSQEFLGLLLNSVHDELKQEKKISINLPEYIQMINKRIEENQQLKSEYPNEYTYIESIKYLQKYFSKEYSIISDLFTGLFCTKIKCCECGIESLSYEPYTMLPLPLEENSSLEQCLENFCVEEKLTDNNKYDCEKCKHKVDALKETKILRNPKILIIQLKRFINTSRGVRKKNTQIDIPLILDNTYELYALNKHSGSLNSGHYIACTKNPYNKKWYMYSDSIVERIIDDNDLNLELNNPDNYLLFYIRKDM